MGKNALFVAQRKNYFQAQTEEVPRILVVLLLVRERQQRGKGRQNIGTDKLIPEKNAIFLMRC